MPESDSGRLDAIVDAVRKRLINGMARQYTGTISLEVNMLRGDISKNVKLGQKETVTLPKR